MSVKRLSNFLQLEELDLDEIEWIEEPQSSKCWVYLISCCSIESWW